MVTERLYVGIHSSTAMAAGCVERCGSSPVKWGSVPNVKMAWNNAMGRGGGRLSSPLCPLRRFRLRRFRRRSTPTTGGARKSVALWKSGPEQMTRGWGWGGGGDSTKVHLTEAQPQQDETDSLDVDFILFLHVPG